MSLLDIHSKVPLEQLCIPQPLTNGSEIQLVECGTKNVTMSLIVRRVEKNRLQIGDHRPVSQLQKVALERIVTVQDHEAQTQRQFLCAVEPSCTGGLITGETPQSAPTALHFSNLSQINGEAGGSASEPIHIDEVFCWTIVGVCKYLRYRWMETDTFKSSQVRAYIFQYHVWKQNRAFGSNHSISTYLKCTSVPTSEQYARAYGGSFHILGRKVTLASPARYTFRSSWPAEAAIV